MRDRSVVVIFDEGGARLLVRVRDRDPYRGLYDFIGGSCHGGETALACACRALEDDAAIAKEDIVLSHVMDFAHQATQWCVQVFLGELRGALDPEEPIAWVDADEDFFDPARFAGEGYMGHVLSHMRMQLSDPEHS